MSPWFLLWLNLSRNNWVFQFNYWFVPYFGVGCCGAEGLSVWAGEGASNTCVCTRAGKRKNRYWRAREVKAESNSTSCGSKALFDDSFFWNLQSLSDFF